MSFPERFQRELDGRPPKIHPNVEEVYAALGAAGLKIVDQKQHLASPLGARYCVGARAVQGERTLLHLSACEHISEELAKSSGAYSEESLKEGIPNRKVYSRKQITLVVRLEQDQPDNQEASKKAVAALEKL